MFYMHSIHYSLPTGTRYSSIPVGLRRIPYYDMRYAICVMRWRAIPCDARIGIVIGVLYSTRFSSTGTCTSVCYLPGTSTSTCDCTEYAAYGLHTTLHTTHAFQFSIRSTGTGACSMPNPDLSTGLQVDYSLHVGTGSSRVLYLFQCKLSIIVQS